MSHVVCVQDYFSKDFSLFSLLWYDIFGIHYDFFLLPEMLLILYFRLFAFVFTKYFITVSTVCSSTRDLGWSRCGCFSLLEEARMLFLLLLPFSSGCHFVAAFFRCDFVAIFFRRDFVAIFFRLPFCCHFLQCDFVATFYRCYLVAIFFRYPCFAIFFRPPTFIFKIITPFHIGTGGVDCKVCYY